MLADKRRACPPICKGSTRLANSRSIRGATSAGRFRSTSTMTNSSPPLRATVSP